MSRVFSFPRRTAFDYVFPGEDNQFHPIAFDGGLPMYDAEMADQVRRLRRRKRRLAAVSVGLLTHVPAAGLLLSGYVHVRDASDRTT
jgi:hypothetical protein